MKNFVALIAALLLIGTFQVADAQKKGNGVRVALQHTEAFSTESDANYRTTLGTLGLFEYYQVTGNNTFEQSVSGVYSDGAVRPSGYVSWTYSIKFWQRVSVSVTPLVGNTGYKRHFLSAQYILSHPVGDWFGVDQNVTTNYFFDNNLNVSYGLFPYRKWKDDNTGVFFDLGPRGYLNTYQESNPRFWSPSLFYQLGAGARVGRYGDFTAVLDSFIGVAYDRSRVTRDWTRTNNVYLSARTSYAFDSGFDVFGSARWATSQNLKSPNDFSQVITTFGVGYSF